MTNNGYTKDQFFNNPIFFMELLEDILGSNTTKKSLKVFFKNNLHPNFLSSINKINKLYFPLKSDYTQLINAIDFINEVIEFHHKKLTIGEFTPELFFLNKNYVLDFMRLSKTNKFLKSKYINFNKLSETLNKLDFSNI